MHVSYNPKFQKQIVSIHPGEYYCSKEDEMISTILGSCISVIIYDKSLEFAGMNHFMLPGDQNAKNILNSEDGRYGINAMELLINGMIKKGSSRKNWIIKVFGGGHVLSGSRANVPEKNIAFIIKFLETEGYDIAAQDLGGNSARKVFLYIKTGKVLLKHVRTEINYVKAEEETYANKIKAPQEGKKQSGEFISFTS